MIKSGIPKYKITKEIGQGTYSYVFSATHSKTGKEVAIKAIDKSEYDDDEEVLLIEVNNNTYLSIMHTAYREIYE